MNTLPSYFIDFLKAIGLTDPQSEECKSSHRELRELLMQDETLKDAVVETFIQGSYARHTINQPSEGKLPDIDLVVVTRLSEDEFTPNGALDYFRPFLERHYGGKYRKQGRSWGIELENVGLDFVITSAPSEAFDGFLSDVKALPKEPEVKPFLFELIESLIKAAKEPEWKTIPLRIPDREANIWDDTHPLEQIKWTIDKNRTTNGHYIHVVRAIKWWRQLNESRYKYPKGYPLEHIVGFCCPDGITSVAEGITLTLENVITQFSDERAKNSTPILPDHGAPDRNVLDRIDGSEFATFYDDVEKAAFLARKALEADSPQEAVEKWQRLFGERFPSYGGKDDASGSGGGSSFGGGYTPRTKKTEEIPRRRFA